MIKLPNEPFIVIPGRSEINGRFRSSHYYDVFGVKSCLFHAKWPRATDLQVSQRRP